MALDSSVLAAMLLEKIDDGSQTFGGPTPERVQFIQKLAETIVEFLHNYAEVVVPPHPARVTGPGGGPPHTHPTFPDPHEIGRII